MSQIKKIDKYYNADMMCYLNISQNVFRFRIPDWKNVCLLLLIFGPQKCGFFEMKLFYREEITY